MQTGGSVAVQVADGLPFSAAEAVSAASGLTTLDALQVGARARVLGPTAYDGTVIRLLEMGLTPGAEVVLSRRAPSADPIEIEVRGTRICLRRADAARFPVKVIG